LAGYLAGKKRAPNINPDDAISLMVRLSGTSCVLIRSQENQAFEY